jgi:transposase
MDDVIDSFRLDHLGLPAQMAVDIGFVEAIDALLGVDAREVVSSGQATLAMALNCLGFTSRPLYITPQFFQPRNLKFLVGDAQNDRGVELGPDHFNEHKLGRTLDRIAAIGPDRVFLEVARHAFRKEKVAVPTLHVDTTSHSFQGVYEDEKGESIVGIVGEDSGDPTHVVVTHGYSKDHRMDCKQVVQELLVSSDGDEPLMMKVFSGNASDSTIMQERIAKLKAAFEATNEDNLMPRYFVGDSKLYSKKAIEDAKKDGVAWITRVPETVKEVGEVVDEAIRGRGLWNKSDVSRGLSFQEFSVPKFEELQRYIVVRTEASKERTESSVTKKVAREKDALEKAISKAKKQGFACIPDLEKASRQLFSKAEFHQAGEFTFKEEAKPRGRGRPRTGDEGAFVYFLDDLKIKQRVDVVRRARLEGACFVIGTNDTVAPADEILRHYLKDQQGVERSFRFLKDPEYFADAFFLKSPSRIAALMCVMTLALLLFALVQRRIRLSLEASGKTVPDQKRKQTRKPTLRWINQEFEGVDVTRVKTSSRVRYVFHRLAEFETTILDALGDRYRRRYSEAYIS